MPVANDQLPDLSKYTDFLKNLQRDFDAKYKNLIGGKTDPIFQNLASVIKDPARLSTLKSARTKTAETLKVLSAAGDGMSGQQRVDSAKARIAFIKETIAAIKDASIDKPVSKEATAEEKKTSGSSKPVLMASTAKILIDEISGAVNQYFTGRYNGAGSSGDDVFAKSVRDLLTPFTNIVYTQKNRLAAAGTGFDKNIYNSLQLLKKIEDKLQSIPVTLPAGSDGSSQGNAIPPVTTGGVNIVV